MKTKFLIPYKYKRIGWLMFVPSFTLGIIWLYMNFEWAFLDLHPFAIFSEKGMFNGPEYFGFTSNNLTDELLAILSLVGAMLIAFSKEKIEDEFVMKLRLDSLLWATIVNCFLVILSILFIYDSPFLNVMIFNMISVLILFIIRFRIVLFRTRIVEP